MVGNNLFWNCKTVRAKVQTLFNRYLHCTTNVGVEPNQTHFSSAGTVLFRLKCEIFYVCLEVCLIIFLLFKFKLISIIYYYYARFCLLTNLILADLKLLVIYSFRKLTCFIIVSTNMFLNLFLFYLYYVWHLKIDKCALHLYVLNKAIYRCSISHLAISVANFIHIGREKINVKTFNIYIIFNMQSLT